MRASGELPDVLALPVDEATAALEAAGWRVVEVEETKAPGQAGGDEEVGRVVRVRIVDNQGAGLVYVRMPPGARAGERGSD